MPVYTSLRAIHLLEIKLILNFLLVIIMRREKKKKEKNENYKSFKASIIAFLN